MEKICFKCGLLKPISDFYAHPKTKDGHLNKCIECTKKDVKQRANLLLENPDYIEKERKRGREKYHRLNYNSVKIDQSYKSILMKNYREKYPEKYKAKCLGGKIKTEKGYQKHHWSYNEIHAKDVIILATKDHAKAHRFIIYDQERMMYRRCDNMELLDSKKSHLEYIEFCILNKE
jgi:hypothetical protein